MIFGVIQTYAKLSTSLNMNKNIKFLEEWVGSDQSNPFFLTLSSVPRDLPHHLLEELRQTGRGATHTCGASHKPQRQLP